MGSAVVKRRICIKLTVKFIKFSFNSVEALIMHYSEEDSQLPTKLTYAPMKEYYLNKEKTGYTDTPEYHHCKRYINITDGEDDVPVFEPRHPGLVNPGKILIRFNLA